MRRETMKTPKGKFLLVYRYGGKSLYLNQSGVANVGTPDEQTYVNWTRYPNSAQGFDTVKSARAMARKVEATHGIRTIVCRRDALQ